MAMFDKRAIRLSCVSIITLAGVATLFGCTSSGDAPGTGSNPDPNAMNTAGTANNGTAGTPNVMGNPPIDPNTGMPVAGGTDPGRVGLHRLNNDEYNNTVRDLLGDNTAPASTFLAEEGSTGFDNTASALGMTAAQYEKYFNTASTLVEAAFANPAWLSANITCTPTAAGDACVGTLLDSLGLRIYRRPLTAEEKASALAVYDADFARSQDGTAALKEMVRSMVSAASFLYRIEFPVDPNSTAAQGLNGYEMASRLSYLHWSTMPDPDLFTLAAGTQLLDPATLEAQVDRMLNDNRANAFLSNFGGQWLDFRKMYTHSVTGTVFTTFSEELRNAMVAEGQAWFSDFVQGDRPITDWFTSESNFVNGPLAAHYGYTLPAGSDPTQFAKVDNPGDARVGFLGLAHFLTTTSFPGRTSPTKRAVWVMENLLCAPPPQPPPNVPKLEETAEPNAGPDPSTIVNVKARLEAHRQNPQCASCHAIFDPLGLALENFDGIGAYRATYSNGENIDPSGAFGVVDAAGANVSQPFADMPSLAALLATDSRFANCMAKQAFTYAIGRGPETTDDAYMNQIKASWNGRGLTIRNLLKAIVTNDTFRFSRGEAAQ
jgi:hypothetical protein